MKKIFFIGAVLGALSLAAAAQTAPEDNSVTISGSARTIQLPVKLHRMLPSDFDEFKGAYDLANGKTLSLYVRGRTMFAEVEGQARTEIVAAARNVFVGLNEQMQITINRQRDGDVSGELLLLVPQQAGEQATGSGDVFVMTMAQR